MIGSYVFGEGPLDQVMRDLLAVDEAFDNGGVLRLRREDGSVFFDCGLYDANALRDLADGLTAEIQRRCGAHWDRRIVREKAANPTL